VSDTRTACRRRDWHEGTNVVAHPKSRTQVQKFVGCQGGQCAMGSARFPTAPTNRESERQVVCKILTHRTATQPAPTSIHRLPSRPLLDRSLHCTWVPKKPLPHLVSVDPLRCAHNVDSLVSRSNRQDLPSGPFLSVAFLPCKVLPSLLERP